MQQKFKDMEISIIKTEVQYQTALNRIEEIFDSTETSETAEELELLTVLVEKYENEHYPIDFPDPIEAIKFRMEQLGYKQKDLAEIIGLKSRVSEIMNKKRKLSIEMIRKLHDRLGIPTEVLIKEYWVFFWEPTWGGIFFGGVGGKEILLIIFNYYSLISNEAECFSWICHIKVVNFCFARTIVIIYPKSNIRTTKKEF